MTQFEKDHRILKLFGITLDDVDHAEMVRMGVSEATYIRHMVQSSLVREYENELIEWAWADRWEALDRE